jgi:chemotaxis protein MotB
MKSVLIKAGKLCMIAVLFSSCVAKRYLTAANDNISRLQSDSAMMASNINKLNSDKSKLTDDVNRLNNANGDLQKQLTTAQNQLSGTRQQLQGTKAELEGTKDAAGRTIASQQQRLEQLQALINQQKQATEALKKKISDALVDFSANDLSVTTKNGKVYVSLSENLLFPSGSAVVNAKGKTALEQLASVLNNNRDINVAIEGHTDSIPIKGRYADNWDLSVARSTSIVRILTQTYQVDAARVTASGRSKYDPVDTNITSQGRAHNRRTEIILEPKLDELMKLIQDGGTAGSQ